MTNRRDVLLGGTILLAAGSRPLLAAVSHHPRPHPKAEATGTDATVAGSPADTALGPLDTTAQWALIVDFNTGATLLDKQSGVQMPPSSMTKLMTAYIVYGLLKSGRLRLDQTFSVSEKAWKMEGSKMFVQVGDQVKIEDLIRGMIIQSGNDACIVLAEGIAGSEEQFVEMMNKKAKELGLTDSNFRNCTGWPDVDHHMSCADIALLARHIITDFPEYYHYDAEKSFKYNNIEQENRNPLVQRGMADGLKTGHTEAGGYGVVASAEHGGRRVILVLNGMATSRERVEESERLINWAFASFENVTLFTAGEAVDNAKVWLGSQPSVPLVGGRDLVITMPRNWRDHATISVNYNAPLPAPIVRGAALGTLTVTGQGVPKVEVPLLAGADVPRLGLPGRAIAVVSHYVTGS